jgi:hypothetical protein
METPDLDTETFETIPWEHLTPATTPPVGRALRWAGGVVVASILGFLLFTVLRADAPQTVVAVPRDAADAAVPATVEPLPVEMAPAPLAAAPDPDRLYSEADLMAVIPEEEQRAAAVRAEWFVTDFFTIDGDPATVASVQRLLPDGLEVPLPHDEAGSLSYVEWAEATAVRPQGPGRYAVDVAFRTIGGSPGAGPVRRRDVRAVRVGVLFDDAGAPMVLDLPEPIPMTPAAFRFTAPPAAEPPADVLAAAHDAAAAFGSVIETVSAGLDAGGWRIVLLIADPSGLQFPLVARP